MKILGRRLLFLLIRTGIALVLLMLVIETSFGVLGGFEEHLWSISLSDPIPSAFRGGDATWREVILSRSVQSAYVLLLGFGGALVVGYCWGILAARWRGLRFSSLLSAPFSLCACAPGFWFVGVVAVHSFFAWKRPGFANDVVVTTGPDLMQWWHALVVAAPIFVTAGSWKIRAVSARVEREMSEPFVGGLVLSGLRDDEIFYRHVLPRARADLAAMVDRMLPFSVGSLLVLEWAFRYDGIGSLVVASVREASLIGILLGGSWMIFLLGIVSGIRELAVSWATER